MRSILVESGISDFHDKFIIRFLHFLTSCIDIVRPEALGGKSPGIPKFVKANSGLRQQLRTVGFLGYLLDGVIIELHVHVVRVGAFHGTWLTFATGITPRRLVPLRSVVTSRRFQLVLSHSFGFLRRGVAFQQLLRRLVASGGRQVAHVRHALADFHEQTRLGRCTLPRAERARGMIGFRAAFRFRKVDALQAVFAGGRMTIIGWEIAFCLRLFVDRARLFGHADARRVWFYVAQTATIVEATVLREAVALPFFIRVAVVALYLHGVGFAVSATVLERATKVRRVPDNGLFAPTRV